MWPSLTDKVLTTYKGCLATCCEAHTEPATCGLTSNTSTTATDPRAKHSHTPSAPHRVSEAEQGPLVHHPQQHLGCRAPVHHRGIAFVWCQVRQVVLSQITHWHHCKHPSRSRTIRLDSATEPHWWYIGPHSWRLWLGLWPSWRCPILLSWPSGARAGHQQRVSGRAGFLDLWSEGAVRRHRLTSW